MLLQKIDDNSPIIPGHGTLATKQDLLALLDMIKATRNEVINFKKEGLTKEQMFAKGLDKKWQKWDWSFITEKKWIMTLYNSLEN